MVENNDKPKDNHEAKEEKPHEMWSKVYIVPRPDEEKEKTNRKSEAKKKLADWKKKVSVASLPFFDQIKAWMSAIRVRTLPIPTIQVLTGAALGHAFVGNHSWMALIWTWLIAVLITIGANLINDVIDFEKGGDKPDRAGQEKMITAGMISKKAMHIVGISAFVLAVLCSFYLSAYASWLIIPIVFISAVAGYCYTGGPYPIGYLGLSEVFIVLFYGFVCVGTAYYVQTGHMSIAALLCGLQMGLLACLPNALNNFRDMHDDAKVKKMTLAVRHGVHFARGELTLLTIVPFVLNLLWMHWEMPEATFLPFLIVPLAYVFVRGVRVARSESRLNSYFPMSVAIHFGFGILLLVGFLLRG